MLARGLGRSVVWVGLKAFTEVTTLMSSRERPQLRGPPNQRRACSRHAKRTDEGVTMRRGHSDRKAAAIERPCSVLPSPMSSARRILPLRLRAKLRRRRRISLKSLKSGLTRHTTFGTPQNFFWGSALWVAKGWYARAGKYIEHLLTPKNGQPTSADQTPIPCVPATASPGGRVLCEERTLRCSQTGQAWLELRNQ